MPPYLSAPPLHVMICTHPHHSGHPTLAGIASCIAPGRVKPAVVRQYHSTRRQRGEPRLQPTEHPLHLDRRPGRVGHGVRGQSRNPHPQPGSPGRDRHPLREFLLRLAGLLTGARLDPHRPHPVAARHPRLAARGEHDQRGRADRIPGGPARLHRRRWPRPATPAASAASGTWAIRIIPKRGSATGRYTPRAAGRTTARR